MIADTYRLPPFIVALLIGLFSLGLSSLASPALAQQTGSIAGVVVDAQSGETLVGANVAIQDSTIGTATDLNGRYKISGLEPGTYNIAFSFIGFQRKTITGVEVNAGKTTTLDASLQEQTEELEEVVVTAAASRGSEAGLLRERQKSAAASNAISAETISKSGSGDAAAALEKVAGASITDGKYVNIRGLGGRYVNTQLNGSKLPNADPDKNSTPLDLFPSALLENVVATKTFTPDKPGDFTGGNVNINTKAFPTQLTLSFSASASYNSQVGLLDDILRSEGGLDEIPGPIREGGVPPITAVGSEQEAQQLNAVADAFSNTMVPQLQEAPVEQSYSLAFGNEFEVFGSMPLGVLVSGSFSRGASSYTDGINAYYESPTRGSQTLQSDVQLVDDQASVEEQYGALANVSIKPHPQHEFGANLFYNRSIENEARSQQGENTGNVRGGRLFRTETLQEIDRSVYNAQLRGEHVFGSGISTSDGMRAEWKGSVGRAIQDEPDFRLFATDFRLSQGTPTDFTIDASAYSLPSRVFRESEEDSYSGELSFALPVWKGELKVGGSYDQTLRDFTERRFQYENTSDYQGNPTEFFSDANTGIIDEDTNEFGLYFSDQTAPSNNYDGEREIAAGYFMFDTPFPGFEALRLIGGLRVESTYLFVESDVRNPGPSDRGEIDEIDFLPSMNAVYSVREDMNIRAAYGRTLARPTFLEFSPFEQTSFIGGETLVGNTNLTRSTVHNLDLRWEWFMQPGEILSFSLYYKDFTDAIEEGSNPTTSVDAEEVQYFNVPNATVYGFEVEAQKRLGFIAPWLQYFEIGGNLTLAQSTVDIPGETLERRREILGSDVDDTRPLEGQSPYVVNLNFSYENPEIGTTAGIYFNQFGERLDAVGLGGFPDAYEQPRATLDFVASQDVAYGVSVKFSAKNITDAETEIIQTFRDQDYINRLYTTGRSFSFGVKYDL